MGLFDRWRRPLPRDVADASADLRRLGEARPQLREVAAYYAAILPVLFAKPPREKPPVLSPDLAASTWAAGQPLWHDLPLVIDEPSLRVRWRRVAEAAASPDARRAAMAAKDARFPVAAVADALLRDAEDRVAGAIAPWNLEPAAVLSTLRLAMYPVLAMIAASWKQHDSPAIWKHGHCWSCGRPPLLAELRGLEQTRVLRCGLCAADWEFARLQCPFCGCDDHRQLGYLQVAGEEMRWRVATCDACGGCLRTVFTLVAPSAAGLLAIDVATLHLAAAADQRYVTPA